MRLSDSSCLAYHSGVNHLCDSETCKFVQNMPLAHFRMPVQAPGLILRFILEF